jgi:MoaA/NifB/PqqE/SkfB family radical SAM enzyme
MKPFVRSTDTDYHKERQLFAEKIWATPGMLPHRYVLILTNKCNLRCSFCFQEKKTLPGSLTARQWMDFIDQLPDYAWVTLTGGEPFLFPEFAEVFKHVTEKHNCNIITNGLLMTDEIADLLLSRPRFKTLSISIDDIGNSVRGVRPEKWAQAERAIRSFAQLKSGSSVVLDAKTLVLDSNADQILDIHRYIMETLSCDTHAYQLLKGSHLQHADVMFPFEDIFKTSSAHVYTRWSEIISQFEQVRLYNQQSGHRCYLHPKIADLNSTTPLEPSKLSHANNPKLQFDSYHPCHAMWESVHINVDGNLFPCMAVSAGNVKDTPLFDIINGENFGRIKKVLKDRGLVEGCNRCGYLRPKESLL